jgi:hypothetical protein
MLLTTLLLLASSLASSLASANGIERHTIVSSPATVKKESTPLVPASNTLALTRQKSNGYNARSAGHLLKKHRQPSSHTTGLLPIQGGVLFSTSITFGEQTFEAVVDTASSDTWAVPTGFQCLNTTNGDYISQGNCNFGPLITQDSTFTPLVPDQSLLEIYDETKLLEGIMGHEDVTLAGIKVRQEVGVVQYAAYVGDGTTSGVIGLAYPSV